MNKTCTTLIDVETLDGLRGEPQTIIIDCRFSLADSTQGLEQWRAGHIPAARYAHLEADLSGPVIAGQTGRHPLPERDALAARFRRWGINGDTQLVCYDDAAGAFASRFWWLSRWLGHAACAVLDGGFTAWCDAGKPIDRAAAPTGDPGDFTAAASLVELVGRQAVAGGEALLIDARQAARYRGEVEPIDPVAGHIPGAINLPFEGNLGENGRWLSVADLQARYQPVISRAGGRPLTHYCGSGVTAAHNVLAMTHAGLPAGSLYAGSWSEWITQDAGRSAVARQAD